MTFPIDSGHLLNIARELESRGHDDAAEVIRREVERVEKLNMDVTIDALDRERDEG